MIRTVLEEQMEVDQKYVMGDLDEQDLFAAQSYENQSTKKMSREISLTPEIYQEHQEILNSLEIPTQLFREMSHEEQLGMPSEMPSSSMPSEKLQRIPSKVLQETLSKMPQEQDTFLQSEFQEDTDTTNNCDVSFSTKRKHLIPIWILVVVEYALTGEALKQAKKYYRHHKGKKELEEIYKKYTDTFMQLFADYQINPYPGRHPDQWFFVIKEITNFLKPHI